MSKEEGYDKVSRAIASGATAFWKTVFENLAQGGKSAMFANAGITQVDIDGFFAMLGGADMRIGLIPNVSKGTKTVFDSANVEPGKGLGDKAVSGSISIGLGFTF